MDDLATELGMTVPEPPPPTDAELAAFTKTLHADPHAVDALPVTKRPIGANYLAWRICWLSASTLAPVLTKAQTAAAEGRAIEAKARALRDPLLQDLARRKESAGDDEVLLAQVQLEIAKVNQQYRLAMKDVDLDQLDRAVTEAKSALADAKIAEDQAHTQMMQPHEG